MFAFRFIHHSAAADYDLQIVAESAADARDIIMGLSALIHDPDETFAVAHNGTSVSIDVHPNNGTQLAAIDRAFQWFN